jgi:anti-sigma regulatory factor (Ser/Thr protein kinase)
VVHRAGDSRRWIIASELTRVAPLVVEAADYLEGHGVSGKPQFTAQLALEELVTNVVRHGGYDGGNLDIRVSVSIASDEIRMTVEDGARPFDPTRDPRMPDTESPLESRAVGGLGLHLVRNLVRRFEYERLGGTNRVRLSIARSA